MIPHHLLKPPEELPAVPASPPCPSALDAFRAQWRAQLGVAPNTLLGPHVENIESALAFADATPDLSPVARDLERLLKQPNSLLDAVKLERFIQLVGEAQVCEVAQRCGVTLRRVPEAANRKTPDYALFDAATPSAYFEVKTLSVVDGAFNLQEAIEASYQGQVELSERVSRGAAFAIATVEGPRATKVPPKGHPSEARHPMKARIENLIAKAEGNYKPGQYAGGPTCMVLNLLAFDGHYHEPAFLRPVVAGYPEPWHLISGAYWDLAFGRAGDPVYGPAEFEGAPTLEGRLARDGILTQHADVRALLLLVHPWGKAPRFYGLWRESEHDAWRSGHPHGAMGEALLRLVGTHWNDDRDTNASRLAEAGPGTSS